MESQLQIAEPQSLLCKNCNIRKASDSELLLCMGCLMNGAAELLQHAESDEGDVNYDNDSGVGSSNDGDGDDDSWDVLASEVDAALAKNSGRAVMKRKRESSSRFPYIASMETEVGDEREESVIRRIKKVLNHGTRDRNNEVEARQALQLAAKLMQKFGISKEDIEKADSDDWEGAQIGVVIHHKDGKTVKFQRWAGKIANATCLAFNVDHFYNLDDYSVKFVFYGVKTNCEAAALAFEMTYNFCGNLAYSFDHGNNDVVKKRNSYLLGLSSRIYHDERSTADSNPTTQSETQTQTRAPNESLRVIFRSKQSAQGDQ